MKTPVLHPRVYILICALACVWPLVAAFVLAPLGGPAPDAAQQDVSLAALGSLGAYVLTYPAGLLATAASFVLVTWGLLTPTEALALAAPIYIAAGYAQWYVVVPRYFGRRPAQATGRGDSVPKP